MNKYIYCECYDWPIIYSIMATSYKEAINKIIELYQKKFPEDSKLSEIDNYEDLQDFLDETYYIMLSDLKEIDEL